MEGKFIVFEGIDGCGKETQMINYTAPWIYNLDKSKHVFLTREPTKVSVYGKQIRKFLETKKDPKKDADLFTKLYVKDRWFHIRKQVLPMVKSKCIVLSDRYKLSTFSYQLAQGADLNTLIALHENLPVPNLTLIIDITAEEAMNRLSKRNDKKELFETFSFLTSVRENYLKMKEIFPNDNIVIINGMRSREEIFEDIKREIQNVI